MTFDMGRAWNDGMTRVKGNLSLLAILAGVFFFVPGVVLYLSMPEMMDMMMMPGGDPEKTSRAIEAMAPQLAGGALVVALISFVGYGAMIALLGDREHLSVGEAIGRGFRSLPTLIGVLLAFLAAYLLFALVVGVAFALVVGGLTAVSTALGYAAAFFLGTALVVAVLLIFTRLSLTMPVIVLEKIANPLLALRRSWNLTSAVKWRLLGFYALFMAAYLVFALVLMMVVGLIAAAFGSTAIVGFANGIVGAAVAVVLAGLLVGIHRQLAGQSPEQVGETFS